MISLRRFAIAVALVVTAFAAFAVAPAPAFAATPGSACELIISVDSDDDALEIEAAGTVSANGALCVPNAPLRGALSVLNIGVPCGTEVHLAGSIVDSECPN